MDWLGKVLFKEASRAVRRKNMRSLGLALLFALFVCLLVGGMLYMLNKRGRV